MSAQNRAMGRHRKPPLLRPRWAVRARVKRYPGASPMEIASLSPILLEMEHQLGEVTAECSQHVTRWRAQMEAQRLNRPPNVMYEVVVERLP